MPSAHTSRRLGILLALCLSAGPACTGIKPSWKPTNWFKDEQADVGPKVESPRDHIAKIKETVKKADEMSPAEQEKACQDWAAELQKDTDPVTRGVIMQALATFNTPTSTALMTAGLKDSDRDVRIICCHSWGASPREGAARLLSDLLASDADVDVRIAAARALGDVGDAAGVTALGMALESPDPAMQYRVMQSLAKITGKDFGDDAARWRQYVQGGNPAERSLAERVKSWF